MKTAWRFLSGAVAAAQLTGAVWAATPAGAQLAFPASQVAPFAADLTYPTSQASAFETALANPADPNAEAFASIVPSAEGTVVTSAFNAAGACDCGDGCCGCDNACDCGSGCGNGNGCDCGSGVLGFFGSDGAPRWKASAGGVFLSRSQPVPSIIADPIADVVGLRATDFSIGTTVGLDLSIARRFTERGSLEARYLGALEWDVRGALSDAAGLNLGGIALPGIIDIGGGYNSTLHSTEFNWRQQRS
jgi:hypothetical protein